MQSNFTYKNPHPQKAKTEWLQASSRLMVNLCNMKGTTVSSGISLTQQNHPTTFPLWFHQLGCSLRACASRCRLTAISQLPAPALTPPGIRATIPMRVAPGYKLLFQGQSLPFSFSSSGFTLTPAKVPVAHQLRDVSISEQPGPYFSG